jgi:hypothetical protein
MSKRLPKPATSTAKRGDATAGLRKALAKRTKAELIELLLEIARENSGILRQLIARFDVADAPEDLVAATRLAIADATDFDTRDIGRNFSYDHAAYAHVKRNFSRLIEAGELPQAMQLAQELMKRGSCQVEMSDEGLMTDELEACLGVVLKAVRGSDLSADAVTAWCSAMLDSDRVKFIATEKLQSLQQHFRKAAAQ